MARTRHGNKRIKLNKSSTVDKEIISEAKTGWGDLYYDLLQQILGLLPVSDLMGTISLVCCHWKSAAWAVLFWKDCETLDLSPLETLGAISSCEFPYVDKNKSRAINFLVSRETVERQGRCIRNIIFGPNMSLTKRHLALLAERSPKLKKLILPESYYLTSKDVSRIIQKWSELEDLSVGPLEHKGSNYFIRTLGNSCKNLTRLHILGSSPMKLRILLSLFFTLDENKAWIIAENLPKISVFSIDDTKLDEFGVLVLLSKCKNLVELNFKDCRGMVDPSVSGEIRSSRREFLDISESCFRLKDSQKWSIASSEADDTNSYSTQELVNQLWTGNVTVINYSP
ncbi:hypothetical protein PTKIN_Ptkin11bG0180100 [Pterospermum kingtungense]